MLNKRVRGCVGDLLASMKRWICHDQIVTFLRYRSERIATEHSRIRNTQRLKIKPGGGNRQQTGVN